MRKFNVEKTCKVIKSLREELIHIYDSAARYQRSSAEINESVNLRLYDNESYKRLPQWAQAHLRGSLEVLRTMHDRLTVFSYSVDGKRLSIDCAEYRAISPQVIHEKWSDTGAFFYRAAPNNVYFSSAE